MVDEPAPWDFDDPCTGDAVQGLGHESGVLRVTELGDQGHHLRVNVRGLVDLSDSDGNFVGTWTYHLRFGDQFPPDGQGAVHLIAVGSLEYADGHTAIVQVHEHAVFDKETSRSGSSSRPRVAESNATDHHSPDGLGRDSKSVCCWRSG